MTNQDPQLVNVQLPTDTINQTATKILLAIMADDEREAPAVCHYLIIDTAELGCYRYKLPDDVAAALLSQCVAHNEMGERFLREQEKQ